MLWGIMPTISKRDTPNNGLNNLSYKSSKIHMATVLNSEMSS